MRRARTTFTIGKEPISSTAPAAAAAATTLADTSDASVLGSMQLNTSHGKAFLHAVDRDGNAQATVSARMPDWFRDLSYTEVDYTGAGITEEVAAQLVATGYGPVMGVVRGVLAIVIAPAPAENAPGYLFVDFETTGLPFHRDGCPDEHFAPLQVAATVTDAALNVVAIYEAKINAPAASLEAMVPIVRDHAHHHRSARRPASLGRP